MSNTSKENDFKTLKDLIILAQSIKGNNNPILKNIEVLVEKIRINYDLFDKELDIVHETLTELMNIDIALPIIRKTLDKLDELKKEAKN